MSKATLTKRLEFCSSHRYHNPNWDDEKNRQVFGACNNVNTHGHNYLLEVTLCGEIDPVTGMIINLYDLKQHLWDVLIEFDHKNLNLDTPYFTNRVPTTENLALTLWSLLEKHPQLPDLDRILLHEDETLFAEVTRSSLKETNSPLTVPRATITRNYCLSSAMNISTDSVSGHNYTIGITIDGSIDSETGQIINLEQLDELVQAKIIQRWNNKNLSLESDFQQTPPTKENLVQIISQTLDGNIPQGALTRVTVSDNSHTTATYQT
mgnify:CR=1 FL=1